MEGRQLFFLVGAVAAGLLLLSRFFLLVGETLSPEIAVSYVRESWNLFFDPFGVPALSVYVGAFLLGPILALIVNRFYGAGKASTRAIKRYGDEREKLFFQAMQDSSLVLVSMEDRKVYIGWPVYSPDLRRDTKDFRLLPVLSGYRDEQTLELHLTTQYLDAYAQVQWRR